MKGFRIVTLVGASLLGAAVATTGTALADTLSGEISDSMCQRKHEAPSEGGPELTKEECTSACIRGGSKYVLVTDEAVLQIANQDHAGLATHAGAKVVVTGEVAGDQLTVSAVEPAKD